MKVRDKPLVRVSPLLYELVKEQAHKEGIGKTEALENLVYLGLAVFKALKEQGVM